jgi:SAM-dependent methyltransferase
MIREAQAHHATVHAVNPPQEHKETPMSEPGAQYDHIGSKYDEYAQTATLKRAESYTVFRMTGPLAGKRVLDLACGFGFYTRLLKQQGAAQVLGVNISPEMVRLGRAPAHAVGVEVTAITTDDADRRMLGQPGRHAGSGAVRQQVHDAMRLQINQDGAIPMAPPPGPFVDTDDLEGWRGRDRRPPD